MFALSRTTTGSSPQLGLMVGPSGLGDSLDFGGVTMPRLSKMERKRKEDEQRRKFTITNGCVKLCDYNPEFGHTIESVVEDLVNNFQEPLGPENEGNLHFGGEDMAVWQHDRLVAVVRKGPDGKPQATIF
jgi:hypothetical protein